MKAVLGILGMAVLFLAAPAAAMSSAPKEEAHYQCSEPGFTLNRDVAAGGYEYTLMGTTETPTPGYTYRFVGPDVDDTTASAEIRIQKPDGMMIQKIDKLSVRESFSVDNALEAVVFSFPGGSSWMPSTMTCDIQGT